MSTKIIADCCANHLGDRQLIEHMIKLAAEIKVDYIKFQSFKADKLNKQWPDYKKSYQYYKNVELSEETHVFILDKCMEYGIKPLFTVFDIKTARFLHALEVENVKIASPDANNWELIQYCTENFNQVFISTGMHDMQQIKALKRFCEGFNNVTYFYCISKYPTDINDVEFDKMQLFDGFSDHTLGIEASKKAIDLNMEYIERHFTLGKDLPGNDHKISSTIDEFKKLVEHRNYKMKCEQYKTRWVEDAK